MATSAATARRATEPVFFATHAAVLSAVALFGFIGAPGQPGIRPALTVALMLHSLIFIAWCALAIIQPLLIARGQWPLHRKLGWIGGGIAIAVIVSGMAVTVNGIAAARLAPAPIWLAMNLLTVIPFAVLVGVAIGQRRATDWHRRLLASATIIATAPAWARILPMHLLGPFGLVAITICVLAFVAWGMMRDRRERGSVHPAWWWSAAAVAMPGVLTIPLAMLPSFADFAQSLAPG